MANPINPSADLCETLSTARFEFRRNNIVFDMDEEYFIVNPRTYTQLCQMAGAHPLTIQYNYDDNALYLFGMFKVVCKDNAPRNLNNLELITQQFPQSVPVGNLYATPKELTAQKRQKEKLEKMEKEAEAEIIEIENKNKRTAINTLKL